jgi:hypothetical protein
MVDEEYIREDGTQPQQVSDELIEENTQEENA